MPEAYADATALKARFGIPDMNDESHIISALDSASRKVDQFCQRVFYLSTAATRTFVADDLYCLRLPPFNDLVSVTTLKTDSSGDGTFETTWATTDYQLRPVNPAAAPETRPYTEIRAVGARTFPVPYSRMLARDDRVQIVGTFGWPTEPPDAVREATLIIAAELFKLKDAPFGVTGGEFGPMRIRDNPVVKMLLAPYQRYPVLVA